MGEVYWKKTRSNTLVDPKHFRNGLIVWVPGEQGREARVCRGDGPNAELLTLAANEERKRRKATENATRHADVRRRRIGLAQRASFGHGSLFY